MFFISFKGQIHYFSKGRRYVAGTMIKGRTTLGFIFVDSTKTIIYMNKMITMLIFGYVIMCIHRGVGAGPRT